MNKPPEMLIMAARAVGLQGRIATLSGGADPMYQLSADSGPWPKDTFDPFEDDGDAMRLAMMLRINIIFNGSRYYVGMDRFAMDVCCEGGPAGIRYSITQEAAKIGLAKIKARMDRPADIHYCQHCKSSFYVKLAERFSGDVLLVCPNDLCGWQHYRHFYNGVAIHCDINKRHADPTELKGSYSRK